MNIKEILLTSTLVNSHEKDNSFVERLTYLLIFYYYIKKVPNRTITLQDYYWPEFLFLSLPSVTDIEISKDEIIKKYKLFDISLFTENSTSEFNNNNFYTSIPSIKLLSHVFGKKSIPEKFFHPLRNLKFKNSNINLFFENTFSNVASIHIRRGIGTKPNKKYIDELSTYLDIRTIKSYYKKCLEKNPNPLFDITPDFYYFNIIEDLISKNKNQKIYLSYDVPDEFIGHYLRKYPNNIVTRKNYFKEYLNFFSDNINLVKNSYFTNIDQVLINLFDFFALCHSDILVTNQSGWTEIASIYKEKTVIGNVF
jgi:hypothetical protein